VSATKKRGALYAVDQAAMRRIARELGKLAEEPDEIDALRLDVAGARAAALRDAAKEWKACGYHEGTLGWFEDRARAEEAAGCQSAPAPTV
jgi:hypothetical protein